MAEMERKAPTFPSVDTVPPEKAPEKEGAEAPPAAPAPVPEAPPAPPRQKQTTVCRPDQTPWWKSGIEVVAVFVAIVVAIIYWRQLNVMIGQLEQMRGSSDQTDRLICLYQKQLSELQRQSANTRDFAVASTYQAIAGAQSESAYIDQTASQPVFSPFKAISVPFQLLNSGKTRAINFRFAANAVLLPRNGDPNFSYPKRALRMFTEFLEPGKIVPDNLSQPVSILVLNDLGQPIIADNRIISDYQEGRKDILIYERLTYKDVFGVEHWTHYCRALMVLPPGEIKRAYHEACTTYNKADENQVLGARSQQLAPAQPTLPDVPCPSPKQN